MPNPLRNLIFTALMLCGLLPVVAHAKLLDVSVSPKQGSADVAQGQSFNVH